MVNFELINLINNKILNKDLRLSLLFALLMIVTASVLEVVSIGAFLPFIEILLSGKEGLLNYKFISGNTFLNEALYQTSEKNIVIYGIIFFASIVVFKNIVVFYFHYYREHIHYKLQTFLINKLFKNIIVKNFDDFYKKNTAIYYNLLVRESGQTSHSINIFLQLFNELIVLIFVIGLLLLIQPFVTIILILIFFILSWPVYYFTKEKIKKMSSERISRDQNMIKNVNEAIMLFKYLKVNFLERFFLNLFDNNNIKSYNLQKKMSVLQFFPRYYLEAITIIIFSATIILINLDQNSLKDILPLIAVFSFAGLRLLPLIKSLVMGLQEIKRGSPSIRSVCEELTNENDFQSSFNNKKFEFIKVKNLNFNYSKSSNLIKNFNLEIKAGDKILINGPSGSGKTSLIDVLIGIKKQNSGTISIDEKNLSQSLFKELKISYIPQDSYLIDDTIKNNITFPVPNLDIQNYNKIINIVGLSDLIANYPSRDNTHIGERGYKISGGQKQRIIIARSLIIKPEILILDEATNALDINSEDLIIKNIINTYKDLTVMIISHRNLDHDLFNKTINLGGK